MTALPAELTDTKKRRSREPGYYCTTLAGASQDFNNYFTATGVRGLKLDFFLFYLLNFGKSDLAWRVRQFLGVPNPGKRLVPIPTLGATTGCALRLVGLDC
jgi:hypothetical protein